MYNYPSCPPSATMKKRQFLLRGDRDVVLVRGVGGGGWGLVSGRDLNRLVIKVSFVQKHVFKKNTKNGGYRKSKAG